MHDISAFVRVENYLIVFLKMEIFHKIMPGKSSSKSSTPSTTATSKKLLTETSSHKTSFSSTKMGYLSKSLILDFPSNGKKT